MKSGSQAKIDKRIIIHELPPLPIYLLPSIGEGLDFGEWLYPYDVVVGDTFPCIRVIRGALCDKKRTSQLGGALVQDQHVFLVVTHSIPISAKISLFSYTWCYGFIYLNVILFYWIKLLQDTTYIL